MHKPFKILGLHLFFFLEKKNNQTQTSTLEGFSHLHSGRKKRDAAQGFLEPPHSWTTWCFGVTITDKTLVDPALLCHRPTPRKGLQGPTFVIRDKQTQKAGESQAGNTTRDRNKRCINTASAGRLISAKLHQLPNKTCFNEGWLQHWARDVPWVKCHLQKPKTEGYAWSNRDKETPGKIQRDEVSVITTNTKITQTIVRNF